MLRACLSHAVAGAFLLAIVHVAPAADLSELVIGKVEKVVGDCKFTEGPAWHPAGYLLFSDIPNVRIIRVNPDGSHSDWLKPSGGANGLMCDRAGNVYACQGDEQRVTRLTVGPDQLGRIGAVLADRFDGEPFNKPNDLALDADGGLYFTDPNYRQAMPSQPVQGVYYVAADGKVTRVISDLPRPNGILVSGDGKTLYVANIEKRQIMAYPIVAPGTISEGKALFTADETLDGARGPDGMSLDEHGNIYGAYKSIVVVAPDGTLKGRIEIPEKPSNCAFGGADNSTLYVTAQTSLYKVPMKVKGTALQAQGPQGTESVALLDDATGAEDVSACDDAAKTKEVSLQGLKLTVPEPWTQSEPTSSLRLGQFSIPAAEGDSEPSEYVVFPPFGGSAKANIERWIAQFDAEGRESKMTQGESSQGKYVLVELTGTYKKPFGPPFAQQSKPAPGYKMIGVILTSKDGGNYFIKVTGPQKTVAAAAAAIRASFGASADKETKYELADE